MRKTIFATLLVAASTAAPVPALAWDYPGHRIVGAIADMVLSTNDPKLYKSIADRLNTRDTDGNVLRRTLSQVAVYPDCAKSGNVPFCGRVPSKEEVAYVARNTHNGDYHFTDVPLEQTKYVKDALGTDKRDAVQMINHVIAQLRKKKPKLDEVDLTDVEAIWLLAHLVGDIHQPLHVGSAYFDRETCTKQVDPNDVGGMANVVPTIGGNRILLGATVPDGKTPEAVAPAAAPHDNLHLFWDSTVVNRAMQAEGWLGSEQEYARLLASEVPAGWQTAGAPETWAEQWATEILPIARKAHADLKIDLLGEREVEGDKVTCMWLARIPQSYSNWSRDVARSQLKLAGFRLAALLKAIFGH